MKEPITYLLGNNYANCFRDHKELTMDLLGKYPLAPSVSRIISGCGYTYQCVLTSDSGTSQPEDHLICCTVEGEVEIAVHHGFKPSVFNLRASALHRHFVEHETEDILQVFWLCGMGDTMGKVSGPTV